MAAPREMASAAGTQITLQTVQAVVTPDLQFNKVLQGPETCKLNSLLPISPPHAQLHPAWAAHHYDPVREHI